MGIEQEYKNYLREVRKDVISRREQFSEIWSRELTEIFGTPIKIGEYLELEGGFWLPLDGFNRLAPELILFFKERALVRGERVFLRGYDYYCNDPTMHRDQIHWNSDKLYGFLVKKWKSYPEMSFSALNHKGISFEDWIGYLSFFEYCFHDLTSIRWLEFKYSEYFEWSDILGEAMLETDELIERTAEILAYLLRHQYIRAYKVAAACYPHLVSSLRIHAFLDGMPVGAFANTQKDVPFVRATQEGDSLFKIFAAYRIKLLPFIQKTTWKHIMLYGNAFGAMSAGYIMKYLLFDEGKQIGCGSVNYSTHRYYINIFKEVSTKAVFVSGEGAHEDACSIIIDDTVWTATSYEKIVKDLHLANTFLLPLSIDCNSLVHNRQLHCTMNELYKIAQHSGTLAKEVGDSYPIFFSSWDRMRAVKKYDRQTNDIYFREILDGADLLMKHLWDLYFDEYISHEAGGDDPVHQD